MKNKEAFLGALHAGYTSLLASMAVDTSKPYSGQKRACLGGPALDSNVSCLSANASVDMQSALVGFASVDAIQNVGTMSTTAAQCAQNIRACGEEFVRVGPELIEMMKAVSCLADKSSVIKETLTMMVEMKRAEGKISVENRQRMIELDRENGIVLAEKAKLLGVAEAENKKRILDLERTKGMVVVENKRLMLDLECKELELAERRLNLDIRGEELKERCYKRRKEPDQGSVSVDSVQSVEADLNFKSNNEKDVVRKANSDRARKAVETRRRNVKLREMEARRVEQIKANNAKARENMALIAARIAASDPTFNVSINVDNTLKRPLGLDFLDV
jgi:hypothetical protein